MIEEPTPSVTVDRGAPVIVTAYFGELEPAEVYFSYTRPGSERPYVDDGFGQERSRIERVVEEMEDGTQHAMYRFVIDTEDFEAGRGDWVFTPEWEEALPEGYEKTKVRGSYIVRAAPKQLG